MSPAGGTMENARTTPLRILEIVDVRWWNGSAHHGLTFAEAMAARGHDVTVAGIPDSPVLREAEARGIATLAHPGFRGKNPLAVPGVVRFLRREIERRGIQVVNAHRGEGHLAAGLALPRTRAAARLFRTHSDVRPPRRNAGNRWLYRARTARVLVASKFLMREVGRSTGLPETRISYVPPATDVRRFRPLGDRAQARAALGLDPDHFAVGLISRLSSVKGHRVLLDAVGILEKRLPEVRLVFAALDAEENLDDLRRNLAARGLSTISTVVGRTSAIENVIGALDLVAVPSLGSEAVSRVALEALAMEVPVVASLVGGLPDLLEDLSPRLLVPPGDAAALAGAVEAAGRSIEERRAIGIEGRRRIVSRHSLEALGETLEAIYGSRPGS